VSPIIKHQKIMKKLLLILGLMVPMLATAATFGNRASKNRIGSFIADCRHYEGAEVVHLGSFATSLGQGILKIVSIDDPEARESTTDNIAVPNLSPKKSPSHTSPTDAK
jgi:hypothetical protein